jgi:WhiB family transcriptional regulator, redox-sensing transcriptional regulator
MAHDRSWMEDAACIEVDLQVFYPKGTARGQRIDFTDAKSICAVCPVRKTCLAFSIAHDIPYGVWGGWDWKSRQAIDRKTKRRIKRAWFQLHPVHPLSHSIGAYGTIRAPYTTLRDAS